MKISVNLISYILVFGLARGGLFLAPIVVSNLLSVEAYGKIELAQATGGIVALLLGMGLPGTVPLILVRHEGKARWDTLLFFLGAVASVLFIIFLAMFGLEESPFSFFVILPLVTAILMLQGLWSATLKSHGLGTYAVMLEIGFWLTVMIGAIATNLFGGSEGWVVAALMVATMIFLRQTISQYLKHRHPFGLSNILDNIRLGLPLMVTSLFAVIATTAGRVLLGQSASVEAVGIYSVLYRTTALPIVIHQILIIGFFRQLFSWEAPILRQRSPLIIWGVGLTVFLFLALVGPFGWMLGPRFLEVFKQFGLQGKILLFQTVLWSAIALNDLLNSRALIAGYVAWWTGPYLALSLIVASTILFTHGAMADPKVSVPLFVPIYAVLMFGFYTVQCCAMARKGNVFFGLWLSTFSIFIGGMGFLTLQGIYS